MLHYNYFRDYAPITGTYIEADPLGIGGGLNLFQYSNSDPVALFDSLGLSWKECSCQLRNNNAFKYLNNDLSVKYCDMVCKCYCTKTQTINVPGRNKVTITVRGEEIGVSVEYISTIPDSEDPRSVVCPGIWRQGFDTKYLPVPVSNEPGSYGYNKNTFHDSLRKAIENALPEGCCD